MSENKENLELEIESKELIKKQEALNKREVELNFREQQIKEKELLISSEIELKISKLEDEKMNKINSEILKIQQSKLEQLEKIKQSRLEELDKLEEQKLMKIDELENKKIIELEELKKKQLELDEEKNRILEEKERLEYQDYSLKKQIALSDKMRKEKDISDDKMYDKIRNDFIEETESLKEKIATLSYLNAKKVAFPPKYGNTIEEVEDKFEKIESVKKKLEEELAKRPSAEVQEEKNRLEKSLKELKEKYEKSLNEWNNKIDEEISQREIILKNKELEKNNSILEYDNNLNKNYILKLEKELERFKAGEEKESNREARIEEIKSKYIDDSKIFKGNKKVENEIKFVNQIWNECKKYGFEFNKRIIYAFHTALKISDWSIITVLAGVSGTGKSELPRLYAAFGGLNFISVAVQPNWDSQESMLGYFNSIDNRFDAQPLLRFLAQVTDQKEDVSKYMSLILLDEMNLAHVEYYFAEFLSKLELRRGASKNNLPSVEIKLGAGITPYNLELSRTLLWTGTMNQDETTKSLSDKVLDRGIVVNFPRPTKLSTRINMKPIDNAIKDSDRPMLEKSVWSKWIVREIPTNSEDVLFKELENCKVIVENINKELKHCGRALGHRVWQSIEYYIINHPFVNIARNNKDDESTLKECIKFAFEDQIVQKIMPKLRGVETTGNGKKTLVGIKNILTNKNFDNILEDFKFAEEIGYGQFIWSSAEYLEKSEEIYDKLEIQLLGE